MDAMSTAPGQREGGSFSLTSTTPAGGTLTIDDSFPSNEDFVFSGFDAAYTSYTIFYNRGPGYTVTFNVAGTAPTVTLNTAPSSGSTICEGNAINLLITLSGTAGDYNVELTTNHPSGNQTHTLSSTLSGNTHTLPFTLNADATFEMTSVVDDSGSGCDVDPATLPGPVSFSVLPDPVQHPTSATSVCAPNDLSINLSNSESGVEYYVLYDDGSSVSEVPGTRWNSVGGSHTFSGINEGDGQYWVAADGCNGRVNMLNGPYAISPAPSNAFSVTPTGAECAGTELRTNGSETGVNYYVVRTSDGSRTGAMLPGTGGALNFGGINTADTYRIEAEPENGGCIVTLGGSLQIVAPPENHTLNATDTEYCSTSIPNTGIDLYFPTSQSNVTYTLQRWDGSSYVDVVGAPTVAGTGGSINPAWSDVQDGTYRAVATTNLAGCTRNMPGTPTIIENDPPSAVLSIDADNEKCFASGEVFEIDVTLTGNAPFSFELVNTTTGITAATVVGSNDTDYTFTVNPTAINTHTYAIVNLEDGSSCAPVANAGQVDFEVHDLPTISFSSSTGVSIDGAGNASTEVCDGSNITLTGSSSNTIGGYNYRWSNSNVAGTIGTSSSITESPNSTVTYNVQITDGNGCSNDRDIEVIVNPLPSLSFNPPDGSRVCSNEGLVSLVPTGALTGGTFSGTNVDAASASFDPVAAGVGWHNIVYEATDGNGCTNSVINQIRVNDPPVLSISGLNASYCADAGTQTIIGTPNDVAGNPNWEVDGSPIPFWFVDGNDGSATFDVGAAVTAQGDHPYTFIYEYTNPTTGCTNTISESTHFYDDISNDIDFYWRDAGSADPWQPFPSPNLLLCETSNDIDLKAFFNPTGDPVDTNNPIDHTNGTGVFTVSGTGISNGAAGEGTFSAATAGNGNHTITYSYTDNNGCDASVSYTVQIGTTLQFNVGLADVYCSTDNTTHTISGEPTDPAVTDGGILNLYRADLTSYGGAIAIVTVEELLVDGSPNGNVPELDFIPSIIGPDTYVFEYVYDFNGCRNTIVREVVIPDVLDTSFDTDPAGVREFCINDGSITFVPTTPGGNYSGDGVSGDSFSPIAAGAGVHDVTYSINTGGCYSESTIQLTVHDPSVGIALGNTTFCQNDLTDYPVEATNLTISGGVYDADAGFENTVYTFSAPTACFYRLDVGGNRVNYQSSYAVSEGDAPIYFDPLEAPVGTFDLLLDFDNTADGSCRITETLEVTVTQTPAVNFGTAEPLEFCQNSSPVIFEGRYAGGGVTGSGYFMLGSPGNPTAPGIDNEVDGAGTDNNGRAEFDPSLVAASSAEQITYVYEQSGCTSTRTKEFNIRPAPTVFDVTPATPDGGIYCHGGDATIGLSSSEEGVTYELLRDGNPVQTRVVNIGDPETSFDFTPVTDEGTYQVRAYLTALPPGGCVSLMNGSVEVRENKVTAVVDYTINPTCNGALDGEIHVSASSLSSDFTYTLTDAAANVRTSNTGEFTGLPAETYTITVVDGYGCSLAQPLGTVTLDEPAVIALTEDNINNVTCYGGNDGSFRITATGVASGNYQFSIDNGTTWVTNGTSQYTFTNLYAGTYNVQVRDAGNPSCVQTLAAPVVIDEPDGLVTIANSNVTNVDCITDGEIEVEGAQAGYSADFNYVLYREASAGNWVQVNNTTELNGTPAVFPITIGGDYRVDVFGENNCLTSGYYTVIAPTSQPVVNLVGITNESTPGAGDGSIEISISGGVAPFTIDWTGAGVTDGVTLQSNLSAGTYSVRVTDANGCFDELLNLVVDDNDALGLTVLTKDPGPCFGNNNGEISLTATGGVLPYASITLTNSSGDLITPSNLGDTYANYTGLVAGNYTATVVDGQPLSYSENITLSQDPELILSFTKNSDAECFGGNGEITFSATGGTGVGSYEFTVISQTGTPDTYAAGQTNLPLSAGTYELQVRDGNGCYGNHFFEITEPNELTVNVEDIQHVKCNAVNDGEITVSVNGRPGGTTFDYVWEYNDGVSGWNLHSSVTGTSSNTITSLFAGTYRVSVRESGTTCPLSVSGNIGVDERAQLDLQVENTTHVTTCNGESTGSVRLSVTGGTGLYIINYGTVSDSWDGLNDYTVTGLSAGTYTFEVVDDNGCSSTESVTITEPDLFEVNVVDYGIECDDLTSGYVNFNVSGGLDDASGDYRYNVRVVRHENNQVFADVVLTNPTNPVGITDLITTGTDYLVEGTYTLQVYDANSTNPENCLFETQFSLENITIEDTVVHSTCSGQDNGSIDITVSGGSGNFTYTWTASGGGTVPAGQVNSEDLSDLSPGTYQVVLTDLGESNCTIAESYTIAYTNTLAVTASAIDVSCFNSTDGVVTATATGGVAPYDYIWERETPAGSGTWTTLVNSQTLDPVGIGDYRVNIIDANGCTIQSSVVTVDRPDDFSLTIDPASITDVSCNGGADGSFTVTPDDPSGNYEYSIDGGATWQFNETFSGLSAGGYQVSMRDRDSAQPYCARYDIESVVITEPAALVVDLVNINTVDCKGSSTGSIEVEVPTGSGTAPYTYQWYRVTSSGNIGISPSVPATPYLAEGLSAGDYRVRVTDDNGCQVWSTIYEVTEPATVPSIAVENITNVSAEG